MANASPLYPAAADPDGPDAVRMTWNSWPRSKLEASKCVVPIAATISPIHPSLDVLPLPYPPLRCKPPCLAALSPFSHVDLAAMIWTCPFCHSRNHFPPHYSAISDTNVPGELYPQYTTVEYSVLSPPPPPPVFLFVVDTCVIEEELEFVRSAMRRTVGLLPGSALVGLTTYGTQAHLHELGFGDVSKIYVFRGTKEMMKEQILDQLGLSGRDGGYPKQGMGVPAVNGVNAES